jgi:hypothetical protein
MALTIRPADKIKINVIEFLIDKYPGVIIGNEVMYGTTRKVVDLLALYNGETYAIEIKSDKDNVRRLPEQLKEYALIFDHTIVFTHSKLLQDILSIVRPNVSVYNVLNERIEPTSISQRQNRPIKREMLYSISSAYLKRFLDTNKNLDSDKIREHILRSNKRGAIHFMLYKFLEEKLISGFNLFMKEKKFIDDLSLLSTRLNL